VTKLSTSRRRGNSDKPPITIAIGSLGAEATFRLTEALQRHPEVRVIGRNIQRAELELLIVDQKPDVAIITDMAEDELLLRLKMTSGVLVFGRQRAPSLYRTMLRKLGATHVTADSSDETLIAAVRAAAMERPRRNDEAVAHLAAERQVLTPREREVLEYLRANTPYARIALNLGITVNTVKAHATRIRRKLRAIPTE
jgi:DNA-binding NarL/FixJ family response regulator